MNYPFPTIHNLHDVIPHIAGCDDFIVAEKEGYIVVNYLVAGNDTFPPVEYAKDPSWAEQEYFKAAIRRECRGIIFDANGMNKILRRPLHKFFNLGERTETLPDNIDFRKPHIIMDKLDGSMLVPFMLDGEVRWGTKMGLTDVAAPVEVFVKQHPEYDNYARKLLSEGYTPIFEWCSPQNKIVLNHKEDNLILLAVRHMVSGRYVGLVDDKTNELIPQCGIYHGDKVTDINAFAARVRTEEDKEGYVIRFHTGHMIKVKSDWYCNIHKIKEQVNSERSVLALWLSSGLDDAIVLLDEADRIRINKFVSDVDYHLTLYSKILLGFTLHYLSNYSRKDFAISVAPNLFPITKSLIFKMWDMPTDTLKNNTVKSLVLDAVKKSLTNAGNYERMKEQLFNKAIY